AQVHVFEPGVGQGDGAGAAVHEGDAGGRAGAEIELVDRAVLEEHVLQRRGAQVDPVELRAGDAGGADLGVVDVQRPDPRAGPLDVGPGGASRTQDRGGQALDPGLEQPGVLEHGGVRGDVDQLALGEGRAGEVRPGEIGADEAQAVVPVLGVQLCGVRLPEVGKDQALEDGRAGGGATA